MEKHVELIGYPCGRGAQISACESGPLVLQNHDLIQKLASCGVDSHWSPITHPKYYDHADTERALLAYGKHLQKQVKQAIQSDYFPITIGGDHSMAVGTWTGVRNAHHLRDNMGLIWFDAHMDAHTPTSSGSGALHGMPLSYLLGYGEGKLTKLCPKKPAISPENIVLIGVRSYEKSEWEMLESRNVKIYYMEQVLARGLDVILKEVTAYMHEHTKGFGVTIDLDVFDPIAAPGVGSPEPKGLSKDEMLYALIGLGFDEHLKGIEIAEFNPKNDQDHITENLIYDLLQSFFTP